MDILNSQYKIKNKSGEYDVYHFESNQNMVKVLDEKDNELGNLGELIFSGKRVMSGDISDIKVPGLYNIKGVSGLPNGLQSNKSYMLQVEAVGPIGDPSLINYKIIDDKGSIYYKTTTSSNASDWSNSGTSASKTMDRIVDTVGDLDNLVVQRSNIINALNDIDNQLKQHDDKITSNTNTLLNHNHDSAYISLGKPSDVKTTVNMVYNSGFNAKSLDGKTVDNLISVDKNGRLLIGSKNRPLTIEAKNLSFGSNEKIWTSENDGDGSGLDADRLGGKKSTAYALKDGNNNFTGDNSFFGKFKLKKDTSLGIGDLTGTTKDKGMVIYDSNNGELFGLSEGIGINTYGIKLTSNNKTESHITLAQGGSDLSGVSLRMNRNSGDLDFVNNRNRSTVASIKKRNSHMSFNNGIEIDGKKLYIQDREPSGTNHPIGSIWIEP